MSLESKLSRGIKKTIAHEQDEVSFHQIHKQR